MHARHDFSQADPEWDVQEAQWMAQMAGGGRDADAALTCMYAVYGRLFVKRLTYLGLGVEDAQDAAQGLWMEVARAARRYESGTPVRLFLRGFLENARKRHFQNLKALPPLDSAADEVVAAHMELALQAMALSAADDVEYFDFFRCVRRAFAQFEREHPALAGLLLLKHVEEWTLEEISREVGGTAEQVKAEVFSARNKFRPRVAGCLSLWPNRQQGDDEQSR